MIITAAFPVGCGPTSVSENTENLMESQNFTVINKIQYYNPEEQLTYSAGIGDTQIYGTDGVEIGGSYEYDIEEGEIIFSEDYILHITDLLMASNYHIYILDKVAPEILEFDLSGNFIDSYGGYGNTDNTFNMPNAFVTDGDTIYICDTLNRRVKIMSLTNVFSPSFSTVLTTDTVPGYPVAIAMDTGGLLHVLDGTYNRVTVFTKSGSLVNTYSGGFENPVAITIDERGFVYIADSHACAIYVFTKDCSYIGKYPISFPDNSFAHPRLLALDFTGNLVIIAQMGYKS